MPISALLVAAAKETLAWFLGNTFALAAWWVIAGFLSGVFLSTFGGTVSFMLTGKAHAQVHVERWLGIGACGGLADGGSDEWEAFWHTTPEHPNPLPL